MRRSRPSARVLLLDPAGRVLLFRFHFRSGPLEGLVFWGLPGGALEPGETFAAGAVRELAEETGLIVDDPGPEIALRTYVMRAPDGEEVDVEERFYRLRVDGFELADAGWTELEREILSEHRWWSADEIAAATETVYPLDLVELMAAAERPLGHPGG
jgi:8-oxo-dGTP pyrophosphatase MutT (NUDIX family)